MTPNSYVSGSCPFDDSCPRIHSVTRLSSHSETCLPLPPCARIKSVCPPPPLKNKRKKKEREKKSRHDGTLL